MLSRPLSTWDATMVERTRAQAAADLPDAIIGGATAGPTVLRIITAWHWKG
jgi:hypothetical protein